MRLPDVDEQNGTDGHSSPNLRGRRTVSPARPSELSIPKNRSTGNLLSFGGYGGADKARMRFSFDAGAQSQDQRNAVMTEHDQHGLGPSGLRRIRQQPAVRGTNVPPSGSSSRHASLPRSSSMILTLPSSDSRKGSVGAMSTGPSSPTLNFTEDLTRFPSESLHSFSFANQSEEFIHNRQNVLKRSIDFMRDRIGWAKSNPGIASAQARVSGDQEMQSMLELLARANLVGKEVTGSVIGPTTGPAQIEGDNIFDKSFMPRTGSPETIDTPHLSPLTMKKAIPSQIAPILRASHDVEAPSVSSSVEGGSESSSRTPTNDSKTTAKSTAPPTRRQSLKRTYTDTSALTLQSKLMDAMAQPYSTEDASLNDQLLSPTISQFQGPSSFSSHHPLGGPAVHGHASRWSPAAQAIFTTESKAPWTILAANDLACLVFGVTKAEVRKMGILEVVREERRAWLTEKLSLPGSKPESQSSSPAHSANASHQGSPSRTSTSALMSRGGLTAKLLSKPPAKNGSNRRAQTDDGAGSSIAAARKEAATKGGSHHANTKSRGVLLCGDVVPIRKRNGATGSASLWVKEKRHGLIWVLEEIHEDIATLTVDDDGQVTQASGDAESIWGPQQSLKGLDISKLIPHMPRLGDDQKSDEVDYAELASTRYYACRNSGRSNIPALVEKIPHSRSLKVSSYPHIAGIMCLSAKSLEITSSNSVFAAALFGHEKPNGMGIDSIIPGFDRLLHVLTEEDGVDLVDGMVIPEHSFRRARAYLALRENKVDAAAHFLRPDGLPARHRDGSEIKIDVQMRVVKSEKRMPYMEETVIEEDEDASYPLHQTISHEPSTEIVYALWITYSRHVHSIIQELGSASPLLSGHQTPLRQPSPGQNEVTSPLDMDSDEPKKEPSHASLLAEQLKVAAKRTAAALTGVDMENTDASLRRHDVPEIVEPESKKTIDDFVILEDMGQGAYGQVKLARYKKTGTKSVLKYVTKRRILVDTWTRDRRLGTVPLEIHVLDYLRRDGLRHPNIVEMSDFFEDNVNYYIEMVPHGLPGMDLFDYIELRVNMEEQECRSIFLQVAEAIHHLHTKALVVHRDIKDENVVLDGEGNIKLIDFGSAAYIKNGPFDVFVGTIDYAAPEVLAGKPYRGKEQDVWALGILLYTIIYKENPFYSIDEIMDRDLRVPYVMSEDSIDLVRGMLDRDVEARLDIQGVMDHPWFLDQEV